MPIFSAALLVLVCSPSTIRLSCFSLEKLTRVDLVRQFLIALGKLGCRNGENFLLMMVQVIVLNGKLAVEENQGVPDHGGAAMLL